MLGTIKKMTTSLREVAHYALPVGQEELPLNPLIGRNLSLRYSGNIYCVACGRKTNKSFAQGHCYPCMKKLAACDICVVRPETCHYHVGTCREPDWGDRHCMIEHVVYLANTSGIKVGITRASQVLTRWMDQGASQALPIFRAATRQVSGFIEVAIAENVPDKTNWRRLLKGVHEELDLHQRAQGIAADIEPRLNELKTRYGDHTIEEIRSELTAIRYPVEEYPQTIVSLNFDKNPLVAGELIGIKGQYLLFDCGVINVRKFTGYEIEVNV